MNGTSAAVAGRSSAGSDRRARPQPPIAERGGEHDHGGRPKDDISPRAVHPCLPSVGAGRRGESAARPTRPVRGWRVDDERCSDLRPTPGSRGAGPDRGTAADQGVRRKNRQMEVRRSLPGSSRRARAGARAPRHPLRLRARHDRVGQVLGEPQLVEHLTPSRVLLSLCSAPRRGRKRRHGAQPSPACTSTAGPGAEPAPPRWHQPTPAGRGDLPRVTNPAYR